MDYIMATISKRHCIKTSNRRLYGMLCFLVNIPKQDIEGGIVF